MTRTERQQEEVRWSFARHEPKRTGEFQLRARRATVGTTLVAALAMVACDGPADARRDKAAVEAPSAGPAVAPAAPAPPAAVAPAPSAPVVAAPSAGSTPDEAAVSLSEHHRHHHHGGVTSFVAMSLATLGADPAKREAIEKIQSDLNARLAAGRDAEKTLLTGLADGIAAGKIDPVAADAAVVRLAAASSAAHNSSADSLNELHALLSPAERAALVDKVRAHWHVWRNVNLEADPSGRGPGSRLADLAEELALTPDQVEKISAGLKNSLSGWHEKFDPAEVEAHVSAFAAAFVTSPFDAMSLRGGPGADGHLAAQGASRMVLFYEAVTPQLTPDQRTQLADDLREHLTHQKANAE